MDKINKRYIDLIKKMVTDYHRIEFEEYKPYYLTYTFKSKFVNAIDRILRKRGAAIVQTVKSKKEKRIFGLDWPACAETMIGIKRLENIEYCVLDIIKNNVEGDLIETGVWRGGAAIFMKALLETVNDQKRVVWAADSFAGLPKPDGKYPEDIKSRYHKEKELAVSLETVKSNFEKYDLLDDRVRFLKGWFKDTLPSAPIGKLAILRLDGDMYQSTIEALNILYPKLSKGGYCIIDDYGLPPCKQAVDDYREIHNIGEEIKVIDSTGMYWKKRESLLLPQPEVAC